MWVLRGDTLFGSRRGIDDLSRRSVRGGVTTFSAQGLQFAVRTAGTVILARLLTPDDFGLIGMVTVLIAFAAMFRDAGLSVTTIQAPRITRDETAMLFWVNAGAALGIALVIVAAAPVVAWFYRQPELLAVTIALALPFVLLGLATQHQALLRRHMMFRTLALVQIAGQLAYEVVAVALALAGVGYWALVGGSVSIALTVLLLSLVCCRWVPGPPRRHSGVQRLLGFGGRVTGYDVANYLSRNMDNILIGRYLGADALGLYTRAYRIFLLPTTEIRGPVNQVALPTLSSLRDEPERYERYYLRVLTILATLTMPAAACCVIEGEFLVRLILGQQWIAAVPAFRTLAVVGIIQPPITTLGVVLVSLGLSKRYLRWGVATAAVYITSFAVGLPYGIEGVALAYAVANYLLVVPAVLYCLRGTSVRLGSFLAALAVPLACSGTAAVAAVAAGVAFGGPGGWSDGAALAAFAGVYAAVTVARPSVRDTIRRAIQGRSR